MLTLDQQREAPRLVVALNTTPTAVGKCQQAAEDVKVLDVLKGIWHRLEAGLDGAWLGPSGSRGQALAAGDDEERWARTVTAMMLGTAYSGSDPSYHISDVDFYDAMLTDAGPYPLTVACQQLSTVGLISRGFNRSHFNTGANAGGSKGLPIWSLPGAAWYDDVSMKQIDQAVKKSPPVGPGSLYEFYDSSSGPNTGPAHIGFLARVHRVMDGKAWNGVQFVDTGGMNSPHRGDAPGTVLETYKTFDDPWIDVVQGPGGSPDKCGLGVLPPSPGGLSAATDRMTKLWPLGFARLVIKRLSDGGTMYATPLLPMHHTGSDTQNFGPARLLWSLRGMNHLDVLTAEWRLYIPRGKTLRDFAGQITQPMDHPIADTSVLIAHSKHTIGTQNQVKAEIVYGKGGPDNLPWGVRSGQVLPALADVPEYLRGGET